jgi:hypothetical protein
MTYAAITAAFLLLTPVLNPPARAEAPNPIAVTIDGQSAPGPALQFGRPHPVTASAASGAPVTIAATGGCMFTTQSVGAQTLGVLRATFAGEPCVLTLTAPAAGEFAAGSEQITLSTTRGVQRARIAATGGRIAPGTTTRLAARQIGTDQGVKVSWRVTQGRGNCSVVLTKSSRVLQAGRSPGRCTVVASAPGVRGQYQPFRQTLRFTIR